MKTSVSRSARRARLSARRVAASAAVVAAVLCIPTAAQASELVDLHVEANGRALVPGFSYQTDTARIRTSKFGRGCNGSGERTTLEGSTAMGTLIHASGTRRALRPLRISDEFDIGLFVCGVGRSLGSAESFWLYKVNHEAPEVGGDQLEVDSGDEVLWYFSNSKTGQNTGDELDIFSPPRARVGRDLRVRVVAYDASGRREPAAGATVSFGRQQVTASSRGVATLRPGRDGELALRARRGDDIPSTTRVCVAKRLNRCAPVRGKRIFGTRGADRLRGRRGEDVVSGAGGNDLIDVRGRRRDVVRCGRGRDRVRASRSDRVARDCEVVNGKVRRRRR